MTDPVFDFLAAMAAAGIRSLEPIYDKLAAGAQVRFRADGDKPGRRNGWAWLHLDGVPAGVFRHYRLGVRSIWRAGSDTRSLSPAEQRAIAAQAREGAERRKLETEVKNATAAEAARDLWRDAVKPDPKHEYLVRKSLPPFGVRQHRDALLVPMVEQGFALGNVQRIYPDGRKLFLAGGRTEGLFWPHGTHMQDGSPSAIPLVIGEGFATMAAIHQATGYGVVAALSAHNLELVARSMRYLFPSRELIVAADDDAHLPANLGLNAAKRASIAIGARLATPRAEMCAGGGSADFADISRDEVAARIAAAKWWE